MRFRDIQRTPTDDAIESLGELPEERPRRPWLLVVASLMLVVLVAMVWGKWAESRNEADQLRAEIKQVYREAEELRTQAVQAEQRAGLAEQRVALLEQQMRSLRAERGDLLQRLEAAGVEKPAPKAGAPKRPARPRAPAH
jgi:Tfp pilus assembly protein PilO